MREGKACRRAIRSASRAFVSSTCAPARTRCWRSEPPHPRSRARAPSRTSPATARSCARTSSTPAASSSRTRRTRSLASGRAGPVATCRTRGPGARCSPTAECPTRRVPISTPSRGPTHRGCSRRTRTSSPSRPTARSCSRRSARECSSGSASPTAPSRTASRSTAWARRASTRSCTAGSWRGDRIAANSDRGLVVLNVRGGLHVESQFATPLVPARHQRARVHRRHAHPGVGRPARARRRRQATSASPPTTTRSSTATWPPGRCTVGAANPARKWTRWITNPSR